MFAILLPMEKGALPVPGDYSLEEGAYTQLVQENTGVSNDLPAWKSQSDFLGDAINAFWKKMAEWLKSLFPNIPEGKGLNWDWGLIFQSLFWFVMISGVLLIGFLFYKYIQSRSKEDVLLAQPFALTVQTREERLLEMIKIVMQEGRWNEAAKLRWRLFLERKGLSMQLTPLEYQSVGKMDLPDAIEQYQHMFAKNPESQEWFNRYNKKLKNLESQP